MALRLRSRRKKKQQVKQDVAEHEVKANQETQAPERVAKNPEPVPEKPNTEQPKKIDTDALLDDLKKDTD